MPVLSSATLVQLAWLVAPLGISAPPACAAGTPHLELAEDTPGEALAVCIHPGLSTNFLFDTKLTHVTLSGRERFRVIADETGLALLPGSAPGKMMVDPVLDVRVVDRFK